MKRPLPAEAFTREETYAATRLPVELATTLIPDAYTEQSYFDLEREQVFARSWIPVCVADEVAAPGDFVVVEAAGRSVIVCRNREGQLRAHHNVCRHRGARLCDAGPGHAERFFKCPYHSWAYDLDGHCLGTPLFTADSEVPEDQRAIFDTSGAKAFDKADYGLYPVRCEQWGFLIFVCLGDDAPPLLDELGDLPERLAALPPRGVAAGAPPRVRDLGQLEAHRRELHGVLPPALGAPVARQGLADGRPLPLARRREIRRLLHDAHRIEHRQRRLARPARDRRASPRTTP